MAPDFKLMNAALSYWSAHLPNDAINRNSFDHGI